MASTKRKARPELVRVHGRLPRKDVEWLDAQVDGVEVRSRDQALARVVQRARLAASG